MSLFESLVSLAGSGAALGAVYYAYLTVSEGRAARAEAAAMHAEAQAVELAREQALQLDRIAALLHDICNTARVEHVTSPPMSRSPQPIRLSALPSMLARLRVALEVHAALGGPPMATVRELARNGFANGTDPMSQLGQATSALQELADVQRRWARDEGHAPV